ncbi:MAG: methylated-DNA--[protein]-cysteine S-methyltransferase [Bacillota bacterium]|nr:methylated-DNA--[protein]-cysteine S-methyltransferase [Bacillota bacterium]
MANVRLLPLRIEDHRRLVDAGCLERPYRAARDLLRAWVRDPAALLWTVEADGGFGGAIALFASTQNPSSARIETLLTGAGEAVFATVVRELLSRGFEAGGFHRIEIAVAADNRAALRMLDGLGFSRDGLLRHAARRRQGYRDVELWSCLRTESWFRGFAFIRFRPGYVVIEARPGAICRVGFLQNGERLASSWLFDAAWEAGIADDAGVVRRSIARLPEALPLRVEGDLGALLGRAQEQILDYLLGRRRCFDLPLAAAAGTEFQRAVWAEIGGIHYGQTRSYGEIAAALLAKREPELDPETRERRARQLARAVGGACGANPLAIVVPCHRVIGADDRLTGFAGGLAAKAWLLDMELVAGYGSSE